MRRFVAAVAVAMLSWSVLAQRLPASRDPETAEIYSLAQKEADAGDARARSFIGLLEGGRGAAEARDGLQWLRDAAERGLAPAQFQMGVQMAGAGDHAAARAWYERAAAQGHAMAHGNLGSMYLLGKGVKRDERKALEHSLKAANLGNAVSQARLGAMYAEGNGAPKDPRAAIDWLEKAARQGHAGAQAQLGAMLFLGSGVPVDRERGRAWLEKAVAQGDQDAATILRSATRDAPQAQARMTFAEAQAGAARGNAEASYRLAVMYKDGSGGAPQDDREAFKWASRAAYQGHAGAQTLTGFFYMTGRGTKRSTAEAASWLRKAADQGNAMAMLNLGVLYENGAGGLPKDPGMAERLYRQAADAGNETAAERLRKMGR